MKIFLKCCIFVANLCYIYSQNPSGAMFGPVKTIVDTDIGPWADDVGTLAMLYNYMDLNLIKILAIVSNNAYDSSAAIIDVMNTYFNYPNIPIGVTKDPDAVVNKGSLGWIEYALANFPHPRYNSNRQAPDAVKLYRRTLARQPDRSVVITSIGYFTNLVNLLNSKPDEISMYNGHQLVKRKVKSLIVMAGEFPSGFETNVIGRPAEVMELLRKWSLPITFIGSEIGNSLRCGANLINPANNETYYPTSPVGVMYELSYDVYGLDGCYDHSAAIVLAKGLSSMFRPRYGNIYVNETGYNYWRSSFLNIWTLRNHIELLKPDDVVDEINAMMARKSIRK